MWPSASFHRPNKKELFRLIHIVLLTQSNPTLSQGKLKMYAKLDFKLTFFKAKSIWVNFRNAPFLFLVLQGTIVVGDSGERTISQDVTFYYPHILPRGTSYCSSYTRFIICYHLSLNALHQIFLSFLRLGWISKSSSESTLVYSNCSIKYLTLCIVLSYLSLGRQEKNIFVFHHISGHLQGKACIGKF